MGSLEVLFTPADFATLRHRDLRNTTCVVFDILRATTTMLTALAHGARAIIPVAEISEALTVRERDPEVLLAGERDGLRIGPDQAGGVTFDLGNSPREFTGEAVQGRTIAITTTNGTRALRACAGARKVFICSFPNMTATAATILEEAPEHLILVCGGTQEEASGEDVLGAGALSDLLPGFFTGEGAADSALMARKLYLLGKDDLHAAFSQTRNGRRLLSLPDLRDDVDFCLRRDVYPLTARMDAGGAITITENER